MPWIIILIIIAVIFILVKDYSSVDKNQSQLEEIPGPDCNVITEHFPEIFRNGGEHRAATEKQIAFLKDVGFDVSGPWSKKGATLALSSFVNIKDICDDKFDLEIPDNLAIDLLHVAFCEKPTATMLLKVHQNEDEYNYDELPHYKRLVRFLRKHLKSVIDD